MDGNRVCLRQAQHLCITITTSKAPLTIITTITSLVQHLSLQNFRRKFMIFSRY